MTRSAPSIAIVGAGLGGLAAASALRSNGFKVDVYEQAQQFARVGAGIQMSPNAMRVLRGLGLSDRLAEIAFRPDYWINREWDTGAVKFELQLGKRAEERYGVPYYLLHRADLHAALLELVPSDCIHLRKKMVGIADEGDGVKLSFADGSEARADAVIGADGVHSLVRETLLGPERPRFSGRVAYRAVFRTKQFAGLEIGDNTKWWGPDRHIVLYFVTPERDEVYFVTSVPEPDWIDESWSAKGDVVQLRDAFKGFHSNVRGVLDACPQVHKWAILERDPLPRWSDNRVVLLGDSCHPMTPYMAQGAAMAMEDAIVLARCLKDRTAADFPSVFKHYEAIRKQRTSQMQLGSHMNNFMRGETNPDWVYEYDAWSTPIAEADALV
jgi:6-hydroxynicotinate 3-monooxygenase